MNRRHINPFYGQARRMPNTRIILQGIEAGHLSLNYFRWQHMTGGGTRGHGPGPFLELAYWIGPSPGVAPTAADERRMNLNRYRDSNTAGTDRWVIFHIHFDPTAPATWLQDPVSNEVRQRSATLCSTRTS
jgi:hypothetical protein